MTTFFRKRSRKTRSATSASPRWEACAESSTKLRPGVNAFWQNQTFHNYADYGLTEAFHSGFARLCALGQEQRCAIMCAEAVWWRCHRRIIADYLIAAGKTVFHILGQGRIVEARMTAAAHLGPDGSLTYPAGDRADAALAERL